MDHSTLPDDDNIVRVIEYCEHDHIELPAQTLPYAEARRLKGTAPDRFEIRPFGQRGEPESLFD